MGIFFWKKDKQQGAVVPFPSATEIKDSCKKNFVSRTYVLNCIREDARKNRTYTNFKGFVSEELKKELTDSGYKVTEYISDYGYYCTEVKWQW